MRSDCQRPTGALPLRPRDLTPCARMFHLYGAADAAPAIPAAESALRSHPCVALSSAQVFPEWLNPNLAVHAFSPNGDNPLNFVSHSRGSLHPGLRGSPWTPLDPLFAWPIKGLIFKRL